MWLMYLGLFIGVYSFYSHELFEKTMALRNFNVDDVAAGREYIEAYVQFFRYAEGEEEVNTEKTIRVADMVLIQQKGIRILNIQGR